MEKIKLTNSLINKGLTNKRGINNDQLMVLGCQAKTKWKRKILGTYIDKEVYDKFIALKRTPITRRPIVKTRIKNKAKKSSDYDKLIKHNSWRRKRKEILVRDNNTCNQCGATKFLHVHHSYYYKEHIAPWLYPNDCLVTLCVSCHRTWHKANKNVYIDNPNDNKPVDKNYILLSSFMTHLFKKNICGIKHHENRKEIIQEFISKN